jgi:hypothetical protein
MRRLVIAIASAVALYLSIGGTMAGAGKPTVPACWGEASAALAQAEGLGRHASDPGGDGVNDPDPRAGLANVARAFFD